MRERLHSSTNLRHALQRRCAAWATYGLLFCAGCAGDGATVVSGIGTAGSPASAGATPGSTSIPHPAGPAGAAAPGADASGAHATGSGGVGLLASAGSNAAVSGGRGAAAGASGAAAGASGTVAGAGGSAGAAGTGMSATATFKRGCKDFDPGPCASFIPGGDYGAPEIELGPYGASLDFNVGKAFAYPIANGDADKDATCSALSNGQTGKVQQPVDYTLYSVYRPGQFKEGEKLPMIVWGDGTCAWPEAYGPLLRYVASYGFVLVAPNSRWVGDGSQMKKGLDFLFAANDDKDSPYYQKLDTSKVGAMGHSQGGSGTIAVASDARVKAVIIWNGGTSASKPYLAVSGDGDILNTSPTAMNQAIHAATVPQAAFLYYHMVLQKSDVPGHLTLVTQPQRVVEPALAWWQYMLNGDAEAKAFFVGTGCKLCNRMAEFEFGQKGLQ